MAKKRRSRRFNLRRVRIQSSITVGALASAALVASSVTNNASDKLRFISLVASFGISNRGAVVDDAYSFGLAHSDYTAAEIEECIEAGGSIDLGDKIAAEQANRLVREIGTINAISGTSAAAGIPWNDGKPVKIKLNWLMAAGDSLKLWVRNNSGTVYTTGANLSIAGSLWVKD